MATWTHYKLVFRLLSPMHIGYRKVGNLMQTRPYVPGKVLWAALTARITRDDHDGSQGSKYNRIGRLVQEHFRFGYLWPSTNKDAPVFPWEDPQFDYQFLGSYASAALNYDQRAAEEGLLHEVEFIAPSTRQGGSVYLIGDLWVKEDGIPADILKDILNWKHALKNLQLGGERTYGWGRVRCCTDWDEKQEGSGQTVAGYKWEVRNGEVVLTLHEGANLTAHTKAMNNGDALSGIAGPIEPLVGWERNNATNARKAWKLSTALVCWAPGGKVKVEPEIKVQVGENGIWQRVV